MEFNQSSIKGPDTSDDHQVSGHFRSYTCTFCKRGFSNAQALGGHMNIHRKDRAKLKEYSGDQSVVSGDITTEKTTPSDHLHTSVHDDSSRKELSEEFQSCSPKRPSREGGDGVGELRKLDLFVETPSVRNDVEESSHVSEHVEKRKQLSHGSSQVELDLDLELRLGFGTSS